MSTLHISSQNRDKWIRANFELMLSKIVAVGWTEWRVVSLNKGTYYGYVYNCITTCWRGCGYGVLYNA